MTLPNFPGGSAPSPVNKNQIPDLNVLLVLIEEFKETVDANDNVAISGDVLNAHIPVVSAQSFRFGPDEGRQHMDRLARQMARQ